ncbi:MAG: flagellar protein FlaG [bacterium]|nr:flagellar protein FlaG [bacterium]
MAIVNVINDEAAKKISSEQMNLRPVKDNNQEVEKIKAEEARKKAQSEVVADRMTEQDISDAIEKMNKTIEIFNKKLKMSYDEESKRVVVRIIDSETDKVIKEIPTKEVLDYIHRLHQMIGVFIDSKR